MNHEELEKLFGEERAAWYELAPMERMARSAFLWEFYLSAGGRLDPTIDSQSPFYDAQEWREIATHGRSGVRLLRRGGI